ncbi:unnamed protein product, partial [marine sediment metagenome]
MQKELRKLFRKVEPETKKKMIKFYIKHLNLYRQGTNVMSGLRIISFERIVCGMAC